MTRARLADVVVASAGAVLLVISAVGVAQVGDDQGGPGASGAPNAVTIVDFAFEPEILTTTAGSTIVWTNEDGVAHTVTSEGPGPLDSGTLDGGDTYEASFSEPGTYAYFCEIHPSMRATVEVS